jgi:hypothetical protein
LSLFRWGGSLAHTPVLHSHCHVAEGLRGHRLSARAVVTSPMPLRRRSGRGGHSTLIRAARAHHRSGQVRPRRRVLGRLHRIVVVCDRRPGLCRGGRRSRDDRCGVDWAVGSAALELVLCSVCHAWAWTKRSDPSTDPDEGVRVGSRWYTFLFVKCTYLWRKRCGVGYLITTSRPEVI